MNVAIGKVAFSRTRSLSPAALEQLARTFECCAEPVWVHDLAGGCAYRNPAASRCRFPSGGDLVQDILDHRDERIGVLRIRPREGR